jgi:hypothetical protein
LLGPVIVQDDDSSTSHAIAHDEGERERAIMTVRGNGKQRNSSRGRRKAKYTSMSSLMDEDSVSPDSIGCSGSRGKREDGFVTRTRQLMEAGQLGFMEEIDRGIAFQMAEHASGEYLDVRDLQQSHILIPASSHPWNTPSPEVDKKVKEALHEMRKEAGKKRDLIESVMKKKNLTHQDISLKGERMLATYDDSHDREKHCMYTTDSCLAREYILSQWIMSNYEKQHHIDADAMTSEQQQQQQQQQLWKARFSFMDNIPMMTMRSLLWFRPFDSQMANMFRRLFSRKVTYKGLVGHLHNEAGISTRRNYICEWKDSAHGSNERHGAGGSAKTKGRIILVNMELKHTKRYHAVIVADVVRHDPVEEFEIFDHNPGTHYACDLLADGSVISPTPPLPRDVATAAIAKKKRRGKDRYGIMEYSCDQCSDELEPETRNEETGKTKRMTKKKKKFLIRWTGFYYYTCTCAPLNFV